MIAPAIPSVACTTDGRDRGRQDVAQHDPRRAGAAARAPPARTRTRAPGAPGRAPAARSRPSRSPTSASTTFARLGPSTATSAIASRIPGNAISTSMTRLISIVDHAAEVAGDRSEQHADEPTRPTRRRCRRAARCARPTRMRARMSRPSSSRPSGCDEVGPSSRCASSCAARIVRHQQRARAAPPATATSTMATPTRIISRIGSADRASRR